MAEEKSISTLFADWRLTTLFVASLPATAAVGFLAVGSWAAGGTFVAVTLLALVGIPILYRNSERFVPRRSLQRRLYLCSLPLNVILVVILSQSFSFWPTLFALMLFLSSFLAGGYAFRSPLPIEQDDQAAHCTSHRDNPDRKRREDDEQRVDDEAQADEN